MLKSLTIGHLRSLGEPQSAPLAPITLVYGPNSGGKSTLLQGLMLLAQTANSEVEYGQEPNLQLKGRYVDLGVFRAAVHKQRVKSELFLKASTTLPDTSPSNIAEASFVAGLRASSLGLGFRNTPERERALEPSFLSCVEIGADLGEQIEVRFQRLSPPPISHGLLDEFLDWSRETGDDQTRFFLSDPDAAIALLRAAEKHGMFTERRLRARYPQMAMRLAAADRPVADGSELRRELMSVDLHLDSMMRPELHWNGQQLRRSRENTPLAIFKLELLLRNLSRTVSGHLAQVRYLGPLRSAPERYYVARPGLSDSVGTAGENLVPLMVKSGANSKPLEGDINNWFEKLEVPYSLSIRTITDRVAGDFHVLELRDKRNKVSVSPSDVGFGMSQLLPMLVEGLFARSGLYQSRAICVEQPEIHLHPKLQAHLADFLIDTAGFPRFSDARGTLGTPPRPVQWIIETHSEALMLRLQRRIREGVLSKDDVSVIYVKPRRNGGSEILPLPMDSEGDFTEEWPGGFFEEAFREKFSGR